MFKMITEYEISIQQENLFTDENLFSFPSVSVISHIDETNITSTVDILPF